MATLSGTTTEVPGPLPQSADAAAFDRRMRLIRVATLAMIAVGTAAAFRWSSIGLERISVAICLTVVGALVNLAWVHRSGRVAVAGNIAVALLFSLIVFSSSVTGGFYDPNFAWIYAIPVAAACIVDLRSGWIWAALVMATSGVFWWLPNVGIELENLVPLAEREGVALFNRLSAICGLTLLASSLVVTQRRSERELAAANAELVRQTMSLQLLQHAAVAANEANTFRAALESCAERIMGTTGWCVAHVWLPASDSSGDFVSGSTWLTAEPERYAELQALTNALRIGVNDTDMALRRVIDSGQPVFSQSGELSPETSSRGEAALGAGLRSAIAVPVLSGGEVIAVLEFFAVEESPFDPATVSVLVDVGRQLGRVSERVILHDRLRQSQKLESVGQLAAGIAHEINNPMAYVRSNLGLLRSEWDELVSEASKEDQGWSESARERLAECEELIDDSLEGVDRTVAIVRDVREFSRSSDSAFEFADPNELLEAALRVAGAQQPDGVSVVRNYGSVAPIECLPGQLRQVFLNLIVNAFQALGDSGTLRLSSFVLASDIELVIEDDGPGIGQANVERLFDPFFTTKQAGEGTGLGLYISYEIVRAHGGEIRVDSTPGSGSRFEVRLPLRKTNL